MHFCGLGKVIQRGAHQFFNKTFYCSLGAPHFNDEHWGASPWCALKLFYTSDVMHISKEVLSSNCSGSAPPSFGLNPRDSCIIIMESLPLHSFSAGNFKQQARISVEETCSFLESRFKFNQVHHCALCFILYSTYYLLYDFNLLRSLSLWWWDESDANL